MKSFKIVLLSFLVFLLGFMSPAQIVISGPQCVLSNVQCQYQMKGELAADAKISICVKGGIITENDATCIERDFLSGIIIKWTEGEEKGVLTISSAAGKVSYSVDITTELDAGSIGGIKKQNIDFNKKPLAFSCSPASGGSCNPSYQYQWQQSADNVKWVNIDGEAGLNLSFVKTFTETTFFRRKTTELSSGTIAYSKEAVVYVDADMKGFQKGN